MRLFLSKWLRLDHICKSREARKSAQGPVRGSIRPATMHRRPWDRCKTYNESGSAPAVSDDSGFGKTGRSCADKSVSQTLERSAYRGTSLTTRVDQAARILPSNAFPHRVGNPLGALTSQDGRVNGLLPINSTALLATLGERVAPLHEGDVG